MQTDPAQSSTSDDGDTVAVWHLRSKKVECQGRIEDLVRRMKAAELQAELDRKNLERFEADMAAIEGAIETLTATKN